MALSAGMAIDWNINKTFLSTPIIYDIRVFSNRNKGENLFFYLQTGQNLKLVNPTIGNGFSAKIGIGAIFDASNNVSYFVDIHKKSKEIQLETFETNGYYRANGFGISLGIIF